MNTSNIDQELTPFLTDNPDPIPEETLEWIEAHPDTELHETIEWDDTIAGHKYRLEQCRLLVKNYKPVFVNRERRQVQPEVHRVHMIPGARHNSYTLLAKADKAKVDAQTRRYLANANGNLSSMLDLAAQTETALSATTIAELDRIADRILTMRAELEEPDTEAPAA